MLGASLPICGHKACDCLVSSLSSVPNISVVPPSCEAQGRSDAKLSHDMMPATPSILQVITLF